LDAYPEHVARISNCDLSYPLHVVRRHHRWLILNAIHRLVMAELCGLPDVAVWPLGTITSPRSPARALLVLALSDTPPSPAYSPRHDMRCACGRWARP
jgi:hypothetical protein